MEMNKKIASYKNSSIRSVAESRYARINWNAHLVPIARRVVANFSEVLKKERYSPIYLSQLKDSVTKDHPDFQTISELGDSITIWLGNRPIATNSIGSLHGESKLTIEKGASLVISQLAASGGVLAMLYPPESPVSKSSKPYYILDSFSNPRLLSETRFNDYLELLVKIDALCSTQNTPSVTASKEIVKLQARESALEGNSGSLFTYIKYLRYLVSGLFKVYRAAHASL